MVAKYKSYEDSNNMIITCGCDDIDHIMKISYLYDKKGLYIDQDLSFETLMPGETFLQRLWHGLKHAFNFKGKWCGFSCSLMKYEDLDKIVEIINEYKRDVEEYAKLIKEQEK